MESRQRVTPDRDGTDTSGATAARRHQPAPPDRAQTTLDFATGMSVFLLVLLSVILVLPGMLEPFTEGSQDSIVVANRIGDQLAEGLLGDPSEPYILNTSCTISFFQNTTPSECRFTGDTVQQRVGVVDYQSLNITLQGNVTSQGTGEQQIICWNGSQELEERSVAGSCNPAFAIGPAPPNTSETTVTARRVVTINESAGSTTKTDVALVVEVW